MPFSIPNKLKGQYVVVFFLLIHSIFPIQAQTKKKAEDTKVQFVQTRNQFAPARNSYHLLNGRKHTFVYPPARGNPYFRDLLWQTGTVTANNFEFDSVLIAYEILNDLLLMNYLSTEGSTIIALNADNIQKFSIGKTTFINFSYHFSSIASEGVYFEKLYQGETGLYLRHSKTITSGSNIANEYRTRETLYLLHNNSFVPIRNKRKLYKMLSNKKKILKQYAREHLPYFTTENHKQAIKLVKYYDELE